MPETVSINEDLGIICVRSYGEVTEQDLHTSRELTAKAYQEHGFTNVLVDAREEVSLPQTASLYDFVSGLLGADMPRTMKFALVVSEHTKRDLAFIETVAVNRGLLVSIFDSCSAAVAWLTK